MKLVKSHLVFIKDLSFHVTELKREKDKIFTC